MDLNRLTQGEKIAAVSAILLFIFMFFDWYSVSISGAGQTIDVSGSGGNAWDALDFIPWVLLITIIVTIANAAIEASEADVDMPVHGGTAVTVLGVISFLLILFRIIDTPTFAEFGGVTADGSTQLGIFLALVSAAGIAFGGYRAMQEEGATFGDAADRLSGGGGGGQPPAGGPPPPPPPPPPPAQTPPPPPPSQPPPGS
ncbi:MAG TPA: hypothetical protein VF176_09035 [Solirubrobacterales bacterium]